jgi:DNA-binding response OmpR family regulator
LSSPLSIRSPRITSENFIPSPERSNLNVRYVLFMTGYTRNAIVHHGRLDAGFQLIGKPFSFQELAARVRARLDAAD